MFKCKDSDKGKVNSRSTLLKFTDGTSKHMSIDEDAFLSAYYSPICYRPSCGHCKFACRDRTADIMQLKEVDRECALKSQGILNHPTAVHPRREEFFDLLNDKEFLYAAKKTTNYSFINRWRQKIRLAKIKKRFRERWQKT